MTDPHLSRSPLPPTIHTTTAFRFKRKHPDDSSSEFPPSKRRSTSPRVPHRSDHRHYHDRRHHRSHHHRSVPTNSRQEIDTETAFRESLFDALADDEGAAFWEGVYGQPIHTYSPYVSSTNISDPEQVELQRMTDDQYATYVRARMWEKSHGHIVEERRRLEEERARRKQTEKERRTWERGVEEALRRGEERRRKHRWKHAWERYLRGWEDFSLMENRGKQLSEQIPWPVETGRYSDGCQDLVERFFKHAPQSGGPNEAANLNQILKSERLRWHPDRFVHRAGSQGLDKETLAMVTAVFQVIDRLWSELRQM